LEQQLRVLLSAATRGSSEFAVALVSLDRDATSVSGRSVATILPLLPKLAAVIRTCMRDTDFVARYGDEEFVVVMPQTTLAGASVFGDRLKKRVAEDLSATVCCGISEAAGDDDSRSLLARADSALYSAKAAGHGRLFVHTGTHIREHVAGLAAVAGGRRRAPAGADSATFQVAPHDSDVAESDEGIGCVTTSEELAV
jgi:diguanylate cyclase (GGDEF)-like protein